MSHRIANLITRWVLLVKAHPRLTLALLCLLTVASGIGSASLFSLNSDVGKLIRPGADTRWYAQNEEHKAAFPQFENTAIVVVSGPRAAVSDASDALLSGFLASSWYHHVAAPGKEAFFDEHALYYLELEQVEALGTQLAQLLPVLQALDRGEGLPGYFELLAQSLQADQYRGESSAATRSLLERLQAAVEAPGTRPAWLALPSAETSATEYQLIILQGRQQFGEKSPASAVIRATREIIAGIAPAHPGVQVRLTGELPMADEELRTALDGIQFAGALSLGLLAIILTVGVRSWSIVLVIFAMLAAGVAITTVFASLVVGSFNTLSLVFLVMFFGLGVDFALHYALRVEESLSLPGEQADPLRFATGDIGTALLLCTITSSIAFLSFFPTEYRGLAELGVISAGGMLIAFFLTLTLIPAWFSLVGMPQPWRPGDQKRQHFGLDKLSPTSVLSATVLVSLAAGWFAKDARFDYSVLAMRDKSSEAIATLLELQREQLATDYSIAVLAEPEGIDALSETLLALPTVAEINRPEDVLPSGQAAKAAALAHLQGLDALALQLPVTPDTTQTAAARDRLVALLDGAPEQSRSGELAAALADLDAPGFARLQDDLLQPLYSDISELRPRLLASPFGLQDLPDSVRSRLIAPDGRHRLEVVARDQLNDLAAMDRFVAEVEAVAPNIAGRTVVERGVGKSVVRSFKLAIVIALTGIVAVLLLYFREPLTPLLVLIPLGLTTLFTFAIVELSGLTLNMANILVVPLIFGLGVDTGIHVVHRYHAARSVSDVLQSSTPRAVTLSALTTIGTFFSLSFSPHKGAASIGLILSIAIAILMVVTFVVLPALLAKFEPLRKRGDS